MSTGLEGKLALVTGVSRHIGIGAAIVHALADAGADIFTTYYCPFDAQQSWGGSEEEAQAIVQALQGIGVRAAGIEADLADPHVPGQLFAHIRKVFGHVDILVNNAAYYANGDIYMFTPAVLDQHYAVNVRGALLLCQAFARQHDGRPGGRIINLTSGQSMTPMPEELPYVATKGAIEALTLSLSQALAPKGITVNAVDPGPTDSGWISDQSRQALVQRAPFGRIGTPADAARLIRFLASEEGQWVTGQIIHSRGGM